MKKQVVLTIGMLGLCFLSSCSAGDQSVETRRHFAVHLNEERLASSTNAVQVKWSKDILSVLASTDAKAISNPKVASAVLISRKNGTYGLFVFWIENNPSVDGVELRFSSQNSPVVIPTPEQELKQIRAEAKDTIAFGSEYDTSELWKSLEQITDTKDLKIRLLRAKAPVTDWFHVDFYKADRWITDVLSNK